MNKKVSVVIPVYNVEMYLDKAVKSVTNQTYNNLEIILVDDGSTDNSGTMCDKYKNEDSRIIVLHDKNEGLSEARNRGIRIATGEYICFLDSDDYLDTTFVQKMIESIDATDADLAICQLWKIYPDGKKTGPNISNNYVILDRNAAFKLMFIESGHVGVYACNKMYKTELFSDIAYPYGKFYEDSGTTYKLVGKCDKIVYYKEPLYYYRVNRPGSIASDKKKIDRFLDKCVFLDDMDAFFEEYDLSVKEAFMSKYMSDIMGMLDSCVVNSCVDSELWKRAKQMFVSHKKQIFTNKKIPIGRKAKGICLMMGNRWFSLFCKAKQLAFSHALVSGYDV